MNVHLYRHFSATGALLYVGVSLSPLVRLAQHRQASHWFGEIARVTIEPLESRDDALDAERTAIQNENPKYNKLLKLPPPKPTKTIEHADRSRVRLLETIVGFRPLYTLQQAADALSISPGKLKILIDERKIGWIYHGVGGRRYITGWQLIEYLEFVTEHSVAERAA